MPDPVSLARNIAEQLGAIPGIVAVVIGGSHARGDAKPDSDIDLGLYYDPADPPSLDALRALAGQVDDFGRADAVTPFGGWGVWINGGAWLDVQGQRVDWLYRDLARVEQCFADCEAGRVSAFYQPGHPHAFYNHIYMGEVHLCKPLFERDGRLSALKARTTPYPPALKAALLHGLWEAGFSLENARKPAARGDVAHVAGYLYRAIAMMTQALFAANERYCINEKGALRVVETFARQPQDFSARAAAVLAHVGDTPEALNASLATCTALLAETQTVCT